MSSADKPQDPVLSAEVERAVAPYRAVFPEHVIEVMEEILEHALTTHPVGAELLDRVRPLAAREHSGSRPKDGVAPADSAEPGRKARAK